MDIRESKRMPKSQENHEDARKIATFQEVRHWSWDAKSGKKFRRMRMRIKRELAKKFG